MTADTKWFEATVTKDIRCDDPCPHCRGKQFHCTDCDDGLAVRHMWGYVKGKPFFAKGTKVMIARSDTWFSEHDWNSIHQSIQYPEWYYVFEPYKCGRKVRVTTAYAIEHVSRIRPYRDMTELGEEALEEWGWQMSR